MGSPVYCTSLRLPCVSAAGRSKDLPTAVRRAVPGQLHGRRVHYIQAPVPGVCIMTSSFASVRGITITPDLLASQTVCLYNPVLTA